MMIPNRTTAELLKSNVEYAMALTVKGIAMTERRNTEREEANFVEVGSYQLETMRLFLHGVQGRAVLTEDQLFEFLEAYSALRVLVAGFEGDEKL